MLNVHDKLHQLSLFDSVLKTVNEVVSKRFFINLIPSHIYDITAAICANVGVPIFVSYFDQIFFGRKKLK